MDINNIVYKLSNDILQALPDSIKEASKTAQIIWAAGKCNDYLMEYLHDNDITLSAEEVDYVFNTLYNEITYWIKYKSI